MVTRSSRPPKPARRRASRFPFAVAMVALLALTLGTMLESAAQPIRVAPSPTPSPTETFDPGLAAQPTVEPTDEPERVSPTEAPVVRDDIQANPTAVPTEEPEPAAPSSLTLSKGACDDATFDPYTAQGLAAFQDACQSPDGEFEFSVANGDGFGATLSTELGSLVLQVPTGPITITETIPEGWGEPAVFCWSNLFPTPSDTPFVGNSPVWDVAEGEDVECWWFNVTVQGGGHDFYLDVYACPEGFDPTGDWQAFSLGCTEGMDGVGVNVTDGQGPMFQETVGGGAEWPGIDFGDGGDLVITETVPGGYGEPVVFCTVLPAGAADPEDFDTQLTAATAGEVTVSPVLGEQDAYHCAFFHIPAAGAPGDLTTTDTQEGGEGGVTVIKHRCPLGVPEDTTIDQYLVICAELFDGVSFTLEHVGGAFPGTTANGGQVEWTDVPAGEIEIQENIPEGYKDPLAFCVIFDGEQELQSGQEPSDGGIVPLTIPEDATNVTCWLFNIQDPDLATSLTVNKWRCHPTFDVETDDPAVGCFTPMDGVTFNLGDMEATTGEVIPGVAQFVDIPTGDHLLTEVAPEDIDHAFIGGCTVNGQGVLIAVGATDFPSLDVSIEAGEHWVCEWYNVPKVENRIVINKRLCDPGLDLIVTDENAIGDIIDSCPTEGDGIEFMLDKADGSSTQAIGGGHTFWDGVPIGPFTVTEQIPDGYGEPIAYCQTNVVDEEGDLILGALEQVIAPGGVIAGSMGAEYFETFHCWVFNAPGDDGDLTVMKWICPIGYDVHAEGADPKLDCAEAANGIQFQFGQPGLGAEAVLQTTGEIIDGGVRFTSLEPGSWKLVEFPPSWAESAFVGSCTVNGAPVPADPPLHEGFEWDIEIDASQTILCHWYNVPDEDASITVEKYLCPVGYDFDAPMSDPVSDCTILYNGVTFNLDDGDAPDPDQSRQTGDDGAGTVVFPGLEPGAWTVTEEVPDGIVDTMALCPTITGNPQVFDEPPRAVFEVEEGDQFHCLWFNVPEEVEENTIIINKWQCPEGAAASQSHHWLSTNCTDQHDGVEFEITTDFGWVVMQTVGGTLQLGPIGPMFHVAIQESIPDGFGDPAVYCAVDDGAHAQIGAPDGFWEHEFPDDDVPETLSCEVYNIPDEENAILIHKWQCPEGTSPEESLDWYEDNCTEEHDGVDFKVASDLGLAVQETSGGQVQFDGLPAGTAGIQEFIPDGFGAPIVFCAPDDSLWTQYDAPTGHWQYDFPFDGVSETLVCYVFNIPGGDGSVTIVKWTCPPGYDLNAAGADPQVDCTEATNGIDFQFGLSGIGEEAVLQTTGDVIDGGVVFDGLEPDTWKAVEIVPEGIDHVFVLECTGHIMGVLQPYPLQMGNVLEIDLDAGEHLVCHWYNVPDTEGGKLTVIKYTCSTETYVSEVDCQIDEDGETFDLLHWNVGEGVWEVIDTAVTDGVGQIIWVELDAGDYGLEEHDGEWCHLTTNPVFGPGDFFSVVEGEETVVRVYNCGGEPGKPGDTPTKYPNTGLPPGAREDDRLQP